MPVSQRRNQRILSFFIRWHFAGPLLDFTIAISIERNITHDNSTLKDI